MTEEETRREIATMLRTRADRLREDAHLYPENIPCARELQSLAHDIDNGAMSEAVRISVLTHEIMLLRAEVERLEKRTADQHTPGGDREGGSSPGGGA